MKWDWKRAALEFRYQFQLNYTGKKEERKNETRKAASFPKSNSLKTITKKKTNKTLSSGIQKNKLSYIYLFTIIGFNI